MTVLKFRSRPKSFKDGPGVPLVAVRSRQDHSRRARQIVADRPRRREFRVGWQGRRCWPGSQRKSPATAAERSANRSATSRQGSSRSSSACTCRSPSPRSLQTMPICSSGRVHSASTAYCRCFRIQAMARRPRALRRRSPRRGPARLLRHSIASAPRRRQHCHDDGRASLFLTLARWGGTNFPARHGFFREHLQRARWYRFC